MGQNNTKAMVGESQSAREQRNDYKRREDDGEERSNESDLLNDDNQTEDSASDEQQEEALAPLAEPEIFVISKKRRKCMAEELQPEHLSPQHEDYRVFVAPQWNVIPQLPYVCYRVAVAILIVAWVGVDFFQEGGKFYSENMLIWLIFATNWGFLLLAVSAVMRAIASLWYYSQKECEAQPASISIMVLWIVYNIAANCALVITVAYWTFLAAFDTGDFLNTRMCELKHTLNSCYILFDLLVSAMPIRLFHMVYPILVGAIYILFNAIYFINDGLGPDGRPYAYYIMDWKYPWHSTLMCSLGFIIAAVMQFILYAFYRLRLFLYSKYATNQQNGTRHLSGSDHVDRRSRAEVESILQQTRERSPSYSAMELATASETLEVVDETVPSLS